MGFLFQTQSPLWGPLAFLLAAFLFLSFETLPFLGFFIGGFALTPLVLIWIEKGKHFFFMGMVLFSTVFLAGWGIGAFMFFILGFVFPAALMADTIHKEKGMELSVLVSTLVPFIVGGGLLAFFVAFQGESLIEISRQHIQNSISQLIEFYRSAGVDSEKIQQMKENQPILSSFLLALSPSFLLVSFFIIIFSNYLLIRFWSIKKGDTVFSSSPLSQWTLPDQWVWGLILSAILLLFPVASARWLGGNLFLIFLVLYLLQGLSLVFFYFQKKKYSLWVQGLGMCLLVFWPALLFVIFLGIADVWADFRKVRPSPAGSSG